MQVTFEEKPLKPNSHMIIESFKDTIVNRVFPSMRGKIDVISSAL